jgi:hypothetical protein
MRQRKHYKTGRNENPISLHRFSPWMEAAVLMGASVSKPRASRVMAEAASLPS